MTRRTKPDSRDEVIRAWLETQVRKGNLPRRTRVGAAGGTPMWLRALVTREGDFLVTRCCIVADADVHPFEVRVDMRKLAGALHKMHALGHLKMPPGVDTVSGFGSFLKKAARAITKNKVTKAVGSVVKKVVSNPIVQIANPMAAVTAHTLGKAVTGRGVIRGPAGKVVDLGAAVAAPAGLQHVGPKAIAALGLGAKTVMASKLGSTVASVAKSAQGAIALGNRAAAQLKAGQISASVATPLVKKALAVRTVAPKVAPVLAKKVALSKAVKKRLVSIAAKAKAGNPDARYTAAVIARTARMTDEISRAQQAAGGGNPGFVITATGKIRKAPKGKFVQNASLPVVETLYRGAAVAPLRGSFSAVSGDGWRPSHTSKPGFHPPSIWNRLADIKREEDEKKLRKLLKLPTPLSEKRAEKLIERIIKRSGVEGMHDYGPAWGGWDDPGDQYDGPLYPIHRDEIAGSMTP